VILRGLLELLRPANVATALADVLAGFGVAGLQNRRALPWLLLSTACLYAGGVVLNDVFDRELDREERPERPLPSGRVSLRTAALLGGCLLAAGVLAATQATWLAGAIAGAIAACVLVYDAWGKRHLAVGPLNMGACRALNLLLGVAAVPAAVTGAWPLALIPLFYIAGVTALSRGEVRGGSRRIAIFALISLSAALLALLGVALRSGDRVMPASVLAIVLVWRVAPPFWSASRTPVPGVIRTAVKRGVLSLVLVDATIGAAYAGPVYAALILATGLVASGLARRFAVT
jgi:4-hydroxybenzoate polyprenyltransferase